MNSVDDVSMIFNIEQVCYAMVFRGALLEVDISVRARLSSAGLNFNKVIYLNHLSHIFTNMSVLIDRFAQPEMSISTFSNLVNYKKIVNECKGGSMKYTHSLTIFL
jgi:hypothetical protein